MEYCCGDANLAEVSVVLAELNARLHIGLTCPLLVKTLQYITYYSEITRLEYTPFL